MYNNELQGRNGPGFAWTVFDSSSDVATAPKSTSSASFTFTGDDRRRVCIDVRLSYAL